MSGAVRPTPQFVTVCDLCDQEITDNDKGGGYNFASLIHGQAGPGRPGPDTKRVSLFWHPRRWPANKGRKYEEQTGPDGRSMAEQHKYDFHGRCIVLLVEENLMAFKNPEEA